MRLPERPAPGRRRDRHRAPRDRRGYGTFLNGAFGLPNRTPNNLVGDGVDSNADMPFLGTFPYIGLPHQGYESVPPVSLHLM